MYAIQQQIKTKSRNYIERKIIHNLLGAIEESKKNCSACAAAAAAAGGAVAVLAEVKIIR